MYPDGDVVDLFFQIENGLTTISDLGETTGWLRVQSFGGKRTKNQQRLIADVCQTHGVEFFQGMLMIRIHEPEGLASAVMRIGQAAVRVADLWFTFRSRAVESIADDVADFLVEKHMHFERREKLFGRSGKTWTLDFHVRSPRRSSLVQVLATGSRGAARGVVEHVLAGWYDLSAYKISGEPLEFVSLFDDTADVWSNEDFRMLDDLSTITRWSRPDDFEQVLLAS